VGCKSPFGVDFPFFLFEFHPMAEWTFELMFFLHTSPRIIRGYYLIFIKTSRGGKKKGRERALA
jgi:hypothetical protein